MSRARLPDRFLWGAATAAHQVEGDNRLSDCWALEHASPSLFKEPSGDAVDQYNRFGEDLRLLADLGLNAYRFGVEWARIEPAPGKVSKAALDHYSRCVSLCRDLGIAPVVTFHHFTQPLWMARLGGMGSDEFPSRFAEYCGRAASALDGVALACTLNELNLPLLAGSYFQDRAPQASREAAEAALGGPLSAFFLFSGETVLSGGLEAHRQARAAIRAVRPEWPVGMTLAISEEEAEPGADAVRAERLKTGYLPFLAAAADDDFIGVQTYSRTLSRADGSRGAARGATLTTMGWEDRPEALGAVCRWVSQVCDRPIYVTENGYPGPDDARRSEFIATAIAGMQAAMAGGGDVRGYFYWSLLDNFEWLFGYDQKFGLIEVQRSTQDRRIKPSANTYSSIVAEYA
ncbi:MAG TPA: family 1 glycosylhydrolase [Caulobacteraceae bacterium]|jgi:beta-glucosidase